MRRQIDRRSGFFMCYVVVLVLLFGVMLGCGQVRPLRLSSEDGVGNAHNSSAGGVVNAHN